MIILRSLNPVFERNIFDVTLHRIRLNLFPFGCIEARSSGWTRLNTLPLLSTPPWWNRVCFNHRAKRNSTRSLPESPPPPPIAMSNIHPVPFRQRVDFRYRQQHVAALVHPSRPRVFARSDGGGVQNGVVEQSKSIGNGEERARGAKATAQFSPTGTCWPGLRERSGTNER